MLSSISLWMELLGLDHPGLVGVLVLGSSRHMGPLTSFPTMVVVRRVSCFSLPCSVASASLLPSLIC